MQVKIILCQYFSIITCCCLAHFKDK